MKNVHTLLKNRSIEHDNLKTKHYFWLNDKNLSYNPLLTLDRKKGLLS